MPRPKTFRVRAADPARPCPRVRTRIELDPDTGRDLTLIYADEVVEVPFARYYRRRVRVGDLVEVGTEYVQVPGRAPNASPRVRPVPDREED